MTQVRFKNAYDEEYILQVENPRPVTDYKKLFQELRWSNSKIFTIPNFQLMNIKSAMDHTSMTRTPQLSNRKYRKNVVSMKQESKSKIVKTAKKIKSTNIFPTSIEKSSPNISRGSTIYNSLVAKASRVSENSKSSLFNMPENDRKTESAVKLSYSRMLSQGFVHRNILF